MGVELQQDDLEVGMYITVLRGRPLYEISLTGTKQRPDSIQTILLRLAEPKTG